MFEEKLKKIIDRFEFLEKEMQGHLERTKLLSLIHIDAADD